MYYESRGYGGMHCAERSATGTQMWGSPEEWEILQYMGDAPPRVAFGLAVVEVVAAAAAAAVAAAAAADSVAAAEAPAAAAAAATTRNSNILQASIVRVAIMSTTPPTPSFSTRS